MDQNTKRDRAQKMRRDKRSKDIKRAADHPSKSDTKPGCVVAPQVVLTTAQRNVATEKTTFNKESAEETKDVTQFANLKRETDDINAINTKSFSKRQITSNWSKYETPPPPEDDDSVSKGADFESLLGAPISEGGHFKFKSEQMWAPNPLQYSDIFSLDVKHLARSLSCIPFYEQVSLPQGLFSNEEIGQMDNEAKQNLERLKTSPDDRFVDNFYNILKSSLADSPPKENQVCIDKKVDLIIESIDKSLKESGTIQDLYAGVCVDTQGSKSSEDEDINKKIDQCEPSNDENIVEPIVTISLPQRSTKRKPKSAVENLQVSREDAIPYTELKSLGDSTDLAKLEDDDELDFLLTLKTPVSGPKYPGKGPPTDPVAAPVIDDILDAGLAALSLLGSTEKKEELEDWLDSMLDD